MRIKILLADDHQLFRAGLAGMFNQEPYEIVGQASNGKEVIEQARKLHPDVILMDISMDGINGIEATQILTKELPEVKVIGLSMHAEKNYIKDMLEAGACGYVLKNCSFPQLSTAIDAVMRGGKYLSEEITQTVISDYLAPVHQEPERENLLTEREVEVLKMYAEGMSTQKISVALFISAKTVGSHKQNIYKKLNIKSPAEMVKFALKKGLITI